MSLYNYIYSPNPIPDDSLLRLLNTEGSYNLMGIVNGKNLVINNFFYIEMGGILIGCIWFNYNEIQNEIEIAFGKLENNNMNRGMLSNILNDLTLLSSLLPAEWTDESLSPKWLIVIQNDNTYFDYISLTIENYGFILDPEGGYIKDVYPV